MTEEQRQEILRRQAEGMRALSIEEIARRQQQAYPQSIASVIVQNQEALTNFYRAATEAMPIAAYPPKPKPGLWARFLRWIGAMADRQ